MPEKTKEWKVRSEPTRGLEILRDQVASEPKCIFFARHGQSTANAGSLSLPDLDVPLTELGHVEAQALARKLNNHPTLVLASDLLRARQTAQYYCERHAIKLQVEPLLNELSIFDFLTIKGLTGDERRPLAQKFWAEADPKAGGHDTFLNFVGRVKDFKQKIMPWLPDQTVCFGHGLWFGMLVWLLLGFEAKTSDDMKSFRWFQRGFPLANCMVYELSSYDTLKWRVEVKP